MDIFCLTSEVDKEKAPRLEKSSSDLMVGGCSQHPSLYKDLESQARNCMFAVLRDENAKRPSDTPKGAAYASKRKDHVSKIFKVLKAVAFPRKVEKK